MKTVIQIADADTLDRAYRLVLDRLTLSEGHREDLRRRGLSESFVELAQYRTLPEEHGDTIAGALLDEFGEEARRVPGVHPVERRFIAYPGLVIPVHDARSRVVALRVRQDEGDPRYSFVSSASVEPGPGPGAPAHVPVMRPTSEKRKDMTTGDVMGYYSTVRVTEGELKADVATALSIERENPSFLTIGLNGPSAFEAAVPALKALGTETVIVALDSDARENRSVAAALRRTVDGLRESGFAVELETWTGGKDGAKDIDDAILANVEITRHSDDTDDDQVDVEVKNIEKAAKLAQPTPEEKRETADLKALKEAVESEDRGEWKERPAQTALRRIVKSDAALERARAIIEDSPVSSREFERNVKELRGENGNEHVSMEFTATMPMDVRDAERQVDFLEKSATLLINESHQAYLHDSGADVLPIRKDHLPYQAYIFKKLLITEETKEYKQIYPILRLRAYQKEPTELVRWAKYDEARGVFYVKLSPGKMLQVTAEEIEVVPLGTDGVYMVPSLPVTAWEYDPVDRGEDHMYAVRIWDGLSADGGEMYAQDAQDLVRLWMLGNAMPQLLDEKPVLMSLGLSPGSGKSTLVRRIGQLLYRTNYNVKTRPKSENDFKVALQSEPMYALDNADDEVEWLKSTLLPITTGAEDLQRTLHTTTEVTKLVLDSFIAITSRTPRLRQVDMAQRIITVKVKGLREENPDEPYKSQRRLRHQTSSNRDRDLSGYVRDLQRILQNSGPFNLERDQGYNFRIADFGSITEWAAPAIGIKDWKGLLDRADQEQREFIKEGDWLLPLIQLWLERTPGQQGLEGPSDIRWVGKDDLHSALVELAKEKEMPYWVQSGQGLAVKIGSARDAWQGDIRLHGPERMPMNGKRIQAWGIEPW
ncbi:MAG: hypothetical protein F4Z28_00905 [Gammaproteobacteria bacterium]|nr:hypothetical protein [Gammaproteobacteria bacterium]